MKVLTTKQKRDLLSLYVEGLVNQGINISFVFGVPLSKWDYSEVLAQVRKDFISRELDIDSLKEYE